MKHLALTFGEHRLLSFSGPEAPSEPPAEPLETEPITEPTALSPARLSPNESKQRKEERRQEEEADRRGEENKIDTAMVAFGAGAGVEKAQDRIVNSGLGEMLLTSLDSQKRVNENFNFPLSDCNFFVERDIDGARNYKITISMPNTNTRLRTLSGEREQRSIIIDPSTWRISTGEVLTPEQRTAIMPEMRMLGYRPPQNEAK